MEDPWFEDGYQVARDAAGKGICLYQKDVREIQLAKAAVRAGIETLLEKYGIAASQVDRIYVAGGFGYQLDYQKAAAIGMHTRSRVARCRRWETVLWRERCCFCRIRKPWRRPG